MFELNRANKSLLQNCPLFAGFPPEDLDWFLPILRPRLCDYRKGDKIASCGEPVQMGILAKGVVCSKREANGIPAHIVELLEPGALLGIDAFFTRMGTSPNDLIADSKCSVLFFDLPNLLERGWPEINEQLIRNANQTLANRCVQLLYRIEVLSLMRLRDRILTFFHIMRRKQGNDTIHLKMNRQQFAQYLCANRSALYRELNQMQKDGLIRLEEDGAITIITAQSFPSG